jgi:hypothetical protein
LFINFFGCCCSKLPLVETENVMLHQKLFPIALPLLLTVPLASCGIKAPEPDTSDLHFTQMMSASSAGLKHVLNPNYRLCVDGAGATVQKQLEVKQALVEWIDAIRDMHPSVTNNVEISCQSPYHMHATVNQGNGTGLGGTFGVKLWSAKGRGEALHEFGHAFAGLGDTYVGGMAGRCQAGQPESIMCWGDFGQDKLYADDIQGIRAQFKRLIESGNLRGANPNADSDSDGVNDGADLCANTAPGAWVHTTADWNGCAPGQSKS